ncbi:MAG: HAD family hydrolase [Mycoplasma sp.]
MKQKKKITSCSKTNTEPYLIVSDLDWTLLNNEGKLDPLTIKVVKRLTRMGHKFCIVTGRPPQSSIDIYHQLGLNTLMINYNGALISQPNDKNFQPIHLIFSFDIVSKILTSKKTKKYITNFIIENSDGVFIKEIPEDENLKEQLFKNFHLRSDGEERTVRLVSKNLANVAHKSVHSVIIHVNGKENLDQLMYELRKFSKTLITRLWAYSELGYIIEINSIFATKGTGLKFASSYYAIDRDRTISFGDGDNDTDMLSWASYGNAMRNATTAAKLSASYITKFNNNEQGVAKWLINHFKLKGIR